MAAVPRTRPHRRGVLSGSKEALPRGGPPGLTGAHALRSRTTVSDDSITCLLCARYASIQVLHLGPFSISSCAKFRRLDENRIERFSSRIEESLTPTQLEAPKWTA